MNKQPPTIRRSRLGIAVLAVLSLLGVGCRTSTTESPAVDGRRVQNATVIARGDVPLQLSAYELEFPLQSGDRGQPRRAALLVDFFGHQGHVRGFTEWTSAEGPQTYVTNGWAHQTDVNGELVTVFQLAVNVISSGGIRVGIPPVALRVVVHERSGDVTLTALH